MATHVIDPQRADLIAGAVQSGPTRQLASCWRASTTGARSAGATA